MKRLLDAYYRFLKLALILLMAVLIVPVTLQIFARYLDFVPRYIWTEELSRFCFIWVIMVGSMIAMRDNDHFNVDLLPEAKSKTARALANLFVDAMSLVLALIFVFWGWPLVKFGLLQTSEMANLPMVFIYVAWPLTGITWVLFLGERMYGSVAEWRGEES